MDHDHALQTRQLDRLNRLLTEIAETNAFYLQKIRECGVTPPFHDLESFRNHFPFTTKEELVADQKRNPPHGSNLTYDRSRYTRFHQTSGTSGAPLRWLDTPQSWNWMVGNWQKVYHAAGVTARDSVFFAFSFGPFLGFWTAFEAAAAMGCLCLPGGGLSSKARLRMIHENGASTVCCTPTYALRLGEMAFEEGIDVTCVKTVIVAGEPGGGIPETRKRIESLWHRAALIDHHGMTEIGPASFTERSRPETLHIMETEYIAEIIEPRGNKPALPGQTGELILTTLGRLGSPLIRYRTGDLVKASADVPKALANYRLDGGILGRIDDMVLIRGVNIYPSAVENLIRRFSQIAEFQVRLETERNMTELSIRIEPHPGCPDPAQLARELATEFQTAFALRVPVNLAEPGSLPRFEMKAKRWVD